MTQWGLDTLFNPAKRHMDEEKRRLQSTREEVGDNSGGKRIDLESGRVTISRNSDDDSDDVDGAEDTENIHGADADADTADAEAGRSAIEKPDAAVKEPQPELTPAQQRARDRRKRPAKK